LRERNIVYVPTGSLNTETVGAGNKVTPMRTGNVFRVVYESSLSFDCDISNVSAETAFKCRISKEIIVVPIIGNLSAVIIFAFDKLASDGRIKFRIVAPVPLPISRPGWFLERSS
jgi:hypothetical protein